MNRVVCWYSCGAASAVATKIAIDEFASTREVVVASSFLKEEHPDNERFKRDCEKWFGRPVVRLTRDEYNSSAREVWHQTKFLVSPQGAACTRILKREVRERFQRPRDKQVFGFTYEEQERFDLFLDANNGIDCDVPLIRHKLTKADCLGMLQTVGIEIPAMYRMGYKNNNCIGCVKGGAGYWNKIRVDFPEVFEDMCRTEELLNRQVLRVQTKGKRERIWLRDLQPGVGRYDDEADIECGIVCQMAAFDHGDDAQCEDL